MKSHNIDYRDYIVFAKLRFQIIDHEFRHNIAKVDKVAVDPRDDSRVDPQTTLTML